MEIYWLARLQIKTKDQLQKFLTMMSKRIIQGYYRYGLPKSEQKFLSMMKLEFKAYAKTGNMEHLVNIANYAFLESIAPENKKFHFDDTVDSVRR